MSLFRLFQSIENNPKRDPMLTPRSEKNLRKIFLAWLSSAYLIGLFFEHSGTAYSSCRYCVHVAKWVPSILVMAKGSHSPDAMRFVLLYHALSAPIWLVLMWIYASDFRRYNQQWWAYIFWPVVFAFFGYVSIYGLAFGGSDTREILTALYHDSLLVSTAVSGSFWSGAVFLIYYFWFYLVGVRLYRWIGRKCR